MELSKKAIDELRFKKKNGKCYYANEVDEALDDIAESVEQQRIELDRLKKVESEYFSEKAKIGEALLAAKKLTMQYVEQEKIRFAAEIRGYEAKKLQIEQEIRMLEQAKTEAVAGLMRDVAALKKTVESFAPNKGNGEYAEAMRRQTETFEQ